MSIVKNIIIEDTLTLNGQNLTTLLSNLSTTLSTLSTISYVDTQDDALQLQITNIQNILSSNNANLDTFQELVDAIVALQNTLNNLLINDLITGGTNKALTAQQGVILKGFIDTINTTILNFETTSQLNTRDTANRSRSNHTGTQLSSTISDLQSNISSNTDVNANTLARHTHSNKTILDAITESFTTALKTAYDNAVTWISNNGTSLVNHLTNTSNPHSTTASQVGAYTSTQTDTAITDAISTHTSDADPHPQYLTSTEGNAAYQPLDADLTAIGNLAGAGFAVRTTTNTWATRSIVAGTGISITNQDGVFGSPSVSINTSYIGQTSITTLGTINIGTWNGNTINNTYIDNVLTGKTYNGLNLTSNAIGFSILGGTTSKTLTINNTLTLSGIDSSTLNIGAGGTLGSAAFTNSNAYEVPLTFSTGLTRTTNIITVNTTQNISILSNLTSNGYIKTSGGTGTLSISSTIPNTDITGLGTLATLSNVNLSTLATGTLQAAQFPALTGDITTVSGSLNTSIGTNKVTTSMLAQQATSTILGRVSSGIGNVEVLTASQVKTMLNIPTNGTFGISIDGAGNPITPGFKQYIIIPYNCIINEWYIIGDTAGSCVIDIWKHTSIPTVANTITGTEKPTLSSQQTNNDTSLTTWTTTVNSGDIIGFNIDSVTTLTKINLVIKVTKI